MAISYQLVIEQSVDDRREIFAAGRADLTKNASYDSATMEIAYPGAVGPLPCDLKDYHVFWDVGSSEYVQGACRSLKTFEPREYAGPKSLLVYFGQPSSLNSLGSNEAVAQELAQYSVVILGEGYANSGHGDYANTLAIVARMMELNPLLQLFGQVTTSAILSTFQGEVDDWGAFGVHGMFLDGAGYDSGVTRADFNTRVEYVHNQGMSVIVNASDPEHILGTTNDPSYPNATYNSGLVESSLADTDGCFLASMPIDTTVYSGSSGYAPATTWKSAIDVAIILRAFYGVYLVAAGVIDDAAPAGQDLYDFGFTAALMSSVEFWGVGDTGYGQSSNKGKWWTRPDVPHLGQIEWVQPVIQQHATDSDMYRRYTGGGRLTLDFSSGAETASIERR